MTIEEALAARAVKRVDDLSGYVEFECGCLAMRRDSLKLDTHYCDEHRAVVQAPGRAEGPAASDEEGTE